MKKQYIIPAIEMSEAELNELMQQSLDFNNTPEESIQNSEEILVRSMVFLVD